MDPIHRHCGDLCSTQDQHSVNRSSTRQSCVRYFQLEVVWLTHSVSSKSCLSQIPGVPLHTHFEGLPDRPYRSTQVFFEHAQIKFGPSTRNPLATPATSSYLIYLVQFGFTCLPSRSFKPYLKAMETMNSMPPNWTHADSTCHKLQLRLPQRPASPTI